LILKLERPARDDGLHESRCTMLVVGGGSHDPLARGMAALFRARAPTAMSATRTA
jgi:hypothetical protein